MTPASRATALPAVWAQGGTVVIVASDQDHWPEVCADIEGVAMEVAQGARDVTFISVCARPHSNGRGDSSTGLSGQPYRPEIREGVRYLLWHAPFRSFNARRAVPDALLTLFLHLHARYRRTGLDGIFRSADTIIIASDWAVALLPRIRRLNPNAKLIFRASDRLSPVVQPSLLGKFLRKHQAAFQAFCLPRLDAAPEFAWAFPKAFVVPSFDRQRTPDRSASEIVHRLFEPWTFPDTSLAGSPQRTQPMPMLSLIVATRGRIEPLARLLSSLEQQPAKLFEVIVVDQNEPGVLDGLLARFSPHLDLIHLRSAPGLSFARNIGLAACRGRIVGFPDDDCWYPPGRTADIVRFFAIYGTVDILLGQTVDGLGAASVNAVRGVSEAVTPANVWFSGNSNTLFMRAPLARALRFDEGLGVGAPTPFQSGEETDLVLRAMQHGARAVYCPNLTIHHEQVDGEIGRAQIRRAWRYSTGFGQVLRRHYPAHYAAYRIFRSLCSALIATIRGRVGKSIYRIVWGVGTMRGLAMSSTKFTKKFRF